MSKILPSGETLFTTNGDISTRSVYSVRIGQECGKSLESENNVFIGYSAGNVSTLTTDCIFLGASAGKNIYSGSSNIILGNDTTLLTNNVDQLISIGYNYTENRCISIGNQITNKGLRNVSLGNEILLKSQNAFSIGNMLETNNSKYFKDSITKYDSKLLLDGEYKFGLSSIEGNVIKNIIYKDEKYKAGYDSITENISNSKENKVNVTTIINTLQIYSLHGNYLPNISTNNLITSYIVSGKSYLLLNNTDLIISTIIETDLINGINKNGLSSEYIIDNKVIDLTDILFKETTIDIKLTAIETIYNLINYGSNNVITPISVIKRLGKPYITTIYSDYTELYLNITIDYAKDGINISIIPNINQQYQLKFIITTQPLYGYFCKLPSLQPISIINKEDINSLKYVNFPELQYISKDSFGLTPIIIIDNEGIIGTESIIPINRIYDDKIFYNTFIYTSNNKSIQFDKNTFNIYNTQNNNYTITYLNSNIDLYYNNIKYTSSNISITPLSVSFNNYANIILQNTHDVNLSLLKDNYITLNYSTQLTNFTQNIILDYKIPNDSLLPLIVNNTENIITFQSIGSINSNISSLYSPILSGNLWENIPSQSYIYVSSSLLNGYFNLGNYFEYANINNLVYIPYNNKRINNDNCIIQIVNDNKISLEYNIIIKNYIGRFIPRYIDITKISDTNKILTAPSLSLGLKYDNYNWLYNTISASQNNNFILTNNINTYNLIYDYDNVKYTRDIILTNFNIIIDIAPYDYAFLTPLKDCIDSKTYDDVSEILFTIITLPSNGFICDYERNPIISFNINEIDKIIYQNYLNINDTCVINISAGRYNASYININVTFNVKNTTTISISDEFLFMNTSEATNLSSIRNPVTTIKSSINVYLHTVTKNIIIDNDNYLFSLNNFKNFRISDTYNISSSNLSASFIVIQTYNNIDIDNISILYNPIYKNQNILNLYGRINYNAYINNYISSNIYTNQDDLNDFNILKYDYQYIKYNFINGKVSPNTIIHNNTVIKFNVNPQLIFETLQYNKYNFQLGFYINNSNIGYIRFTNNGIEYKNDSYNFTHNSGNILNYNNNNIVYLINNDTNNNGNLSLYINETKIINYGYIFRSFKNNNINNIRLEYNLSNNIVNYNAIEHINNLLIKYDLYNYCTSLYFRDFGIIINEIYNDEVFNISYGKNINIDGIDNICIGNKFSVLGTESIIIGNNISYTSNILDFNTTNTVYQSIIIGNNNFNNSFTKNVIMLGNNNFNNIDITDNNFNTRYNNFLATNPVLIGTEINNIDYSMNIANTLYKYDDYYNNEVLFLGLGTKYTSNKSLPVAIGYLDSNIDLAIAKSLYVKGGITIDNISFGNKNNKYITLSGTEQLTENIKYSLPIMPANLGRVMLSTSNDGRMYWAQIDTFYTDNIVATDILAETITASKSFIGDGNNISNLNLSKNSTSELKEGSNLYYTLFRANSNFDNRLTTKTTDNLFEGTSNLYYTDRRASYNYDIKLALSTTDNLFEGTSNLYYTDSRVIDVYQNQLRSISTTSELKEGCNLYYTIQRVNNAFDNRLSIKTTSQLIEGSNLYHTITRVNDIFDNRLSIKNTDNLKEGISNLYYKTSRVNSDFDTRLSLKTTNDLAENGTKLYFTYPRFNTTFDQRLITKTTNDLNEGLNNLYYTNDRVINVYQDQFKNISTTSDLHEGTNLYYTDIRANIAFDNRLSIKTTSELLEGSNLYYTKSRANQEFDNRLSIKNTNNLLEGNSNLYYTESRVNNVFDNRLSIKTTSELLEGSNLYYTISRVTNDFDINLKTRSTSELLEGSNLYYTIQRLNNDFDNRLSIKNTNNLEEGISNLYYTKLRVNNDFDDKITTITTDNIIEGKTNKYIVNKIYNDSLTITGILVASNLVVGNAIVNLSSSNFDSEFNKFFNTLSSDNLIEGSSNLYYTDQRNTSNFKYNINNISTDNLIEGSSNLYYTDQRSTSNFKYNLSLCTLDDISDGIYNNYIISNIYNNNLKINGVLTASNIDIIDLTNINNYIDKQIFKTLNTTDSLLEGSNLYYTSLRATSNFDENLSLISTSQLKEGSNLYYTSLRATSNFEENLSLISTSQLNEGSNLYYTSLRATSNFDENLSLISTSQLKEGSNLYYTSLRATSNFDENLSLISTSQLQEGSNLYYTSLRATSNFDENLSLISTSQLQEGSNLYYTTSRTTSDFYNNLQQITLDNLQQGTSNQYITSNIYNNSLHINGIITASDINIIGPSLNNIINTNFNLKTTDNLLEGSSNKYYSSLLFNSSFSQKTTDDLSEGSINKYIGYLYLAVNYLM